MLIDMGSHVRSSDDKDCGKIKRIVFDGDTMTVRQIVVHEGIVFSDERMVDIDYIDRVDEDNTVHLNITEEQVGDQTPYVHADIRPIATGDMYMTFNVHDYVASPGTVPWDELVLTHGTEVYDDDGKHIGHLDKIVYEEAGHASCFIVEAGRIFTHDVKVPIAAVKSISHNRMDIHIASDKAEAAS